MTSLLGLPRGTGAPPPGTKNSGRGARSAVIAALHCPEVETDTKKGRWFRRETDVAATDEHLRQLQERIATLQRFLASMLEYEAERDRTIAEWLKKLFDKGKGALHEEAERVIGELGADVEFLTGSAAE